MGCEVERGLLHHVAVEEDRVAEPGQLTPTQGHDLTSTDRTISLSQTN